MKRKYQPLTLGNLCDGRLEELFDARMKEAIVAVDRDDLKNPKATISIKLSVERTGPETYLVAIQTVSLAAPPLKPEGRFVTMESGIPMIETSVAYEQLRLPTTTTPETT